MSIFRRARLLNSPAWLPEIRRFFNLRHLLGRKSSGLRFSMLLPRVPIRLRAQLSIDDAIKSSVGISRDTILATYTAPLDLLLPMIDSPDSKERYLETGIK